VLRRAEPADVDALVALARLPEVAGTIATDAADGIAAALDDDAGELLVIERGDDLAGGVRWVMVGRRSRIADVRTLMLNPAYRGRGIALAAVRELVERLFGEHAVHRIEAEVYGFNLPAQRVFERAGFVREGVRRRAYDRAGDWQDGIRYGLLSEDRR
jgi:RimJ/RimL family protein N-acetyltransferase